MYVILYHMLLKKALSQVMTRKTGQIILSTVQNDLSSFSGHHLYLGALAQDFDFEVIAWRGSGSVFDAEGIGGWIEGEVIVMEDGRHRHHQLDLGNACAEAGVVAQTEGGVGSALAVLVAGWLEAINVELLRLWIEFWQEVWHCQGDEDIIARLQPVACKARWPGYFRSVASGYRVAAQGFYSCPVHGGHPFQRFPCQRSLLEDGIDLVKHSFEHVGISQERVDHKATGVGNGIQSGQEWP